MKPIRVLQVMGSLDIGGAEAMIMNIYRKINREKIQFDFVVNDRLKDYYFENEIKKLGGRIFKIPTFNGRNFFIYRKIWINLLQNHPEWEIVHGHNTSPAFIYLGIAKSMNRITIAHSHYTGTGRSPLSYIKSLTRYPLRKKTDHLFSCSEASAEYFYGAKSVEANILKNAIDTNEFVFNDEKRIKMRKELGVVDKFVIGHVARFDSVKNHEFLIDIFESVYEKDKDSILMLVGDGELKKSIEKKVNDLGLTDSVIFTGVRSDIAELLQAMDVFVLPSLKEGLPVTTIEAQAGGLPCIISDTITKEVEITKGLIEFVSLNCTSQEWAKRIIRNQKKVRRNTYSEIVSAGYDINNTTNWVENFYLNIVSK